MQKNGIVGFLAKYRKTLIYTLIHGQLFANIYLCFLFGKINSLSLFYPEISQAERIALIKEARSRLIVRGILIDLAIVGVLFFPLLLAHFKIFLKEDFFKCLKRFREEEQDLESYLKTDPEHKIDA